MAEVAALDELLDGLRGAHEPRVPPILQHEVEAALHRQQQLAALGGRRAQHAALDLLAPRAIKRHLAEQRLRDGGLPARHGEGGDDRVEVDEQGRGVAVARVGLAGEQAVEQAEQRRGRVLGVGHLAMAVRVADADRVAVKGPATEQQFVEDDADGPQIDAAVIVAVELLGAM